MIKSIVLCFAFLFAQLLVLHYIDARLNTGANEARQTATALLPAQRDDEEKHKTRRPG